MSGRIGIVRDGELQVFEAGQGALANAMGGTPIAVPLGYPETIEWRNGAFSARVPVLDASQIIGLFTLEQRGRARRMLFATFPPGHPSAGELIDPESQVQVLMDTLMAWRGTMRMDDPMHIAGVALLFGLGVIESEAERDRILAGIPPE